MREILFRGKAKQDNEWIEGNLVECSLLNDDNVFGIRSKIMSIDSEYYFYGACIPVIPETVGQYTGLTDKNGKKIFESDIINVPGIGKKEIVFYNGGFCFKVNEIYIAFMQSNNYDFEYLGNIHDNPELLIE